MNPFSFATAGRIVFGAAPPTSSPSSSPGGDRRCSSSSARAPTRPPGPGSRGCPRRPCCTAGRASPRWPASRTPSTTPRQVRPDVVVGWGGGVRDRPGQGRRDPGRQHRIGARPPGDRRPRAAAAGPFAAGGRGADDGRHGRRGDANAPVLVPEHRVKASLRSPAMLPAVAVVDPLLTISCPPDVTAASGLDAFTQCLEAYCSLAANPLSDLFAREGLARTARSLRRAYIEGADADARTDLSLAALASGMALANSKLGAVHGLAAPLGGMLGAPHGELCAAVAGRDLRGERPRPDSRAPMSQAVDRYREVARVLTGNPSARSQDGVRWVRETVAALHVRPLAALGLTSGDHGAAADAALAASSMAGNPRAADPRRSSRDLERSS